jgi:hypothetical protein
MFRFYCHNLIVFQAIDTNSKIINGVRTEYSDKSPLSDKMERDFVQSADIYITSSKRRHMIFDQKFVVFSDLYRF